MDTNPTPAVENPTSPPGGRVALTREERLARLAAQRGDSPAIAGRSEGAEAASGSARPARRRHAARKSRAAALGLSVASTTVMSVVFAYSDRSPASATLVRIAAAPAQTTAAAAAATSIPTPIVAPTVVPATPSVAATTKKQVAASAAATFTGRVSTNRWGPVQVQINVTNGKITKVTALQTPSDKSKSVRINNRAVPILRSEALAAQSAQVHTVSGATYTSDSYAASLQSAIDSAQSAGVGVS